MATFTLVNVGSAPGDGTGDLLRDAFIKVNTALQALNTELGGVPTDSDITALQTAIATINAALPGLATDADVVAVSSALATLGTTVAGLPTTSAVNSAISVALAGLATVAASGNAADLTGTLNAARLPAVADVAGTHGNASNVPVVTVDGTGRVIAVSTVELVASGVVPQFDGGDVTSPSSGSIVLSIAAGAVTFAKMAAGAVASAAELLSNTASKLVSVASLWAAQSFVTIAYGAAPVIDGSAGVNFVITLAGNPTFAAPTNMKDGQGVLLKLVQDATGSRVPAWNTAFDWGSSGAPTLSTGAGKVDYVSGIYDSTRAKLVMGLFSKAP